jgi:hypothetical protein
MNNQPKARWRWYEHIAALTGLPVAFVAVIGEREYKIQGADAGFPERIRKLALSAYSTDKRP